MFWGCLLNRICSDGWIHGLFVDLGGVFGVILALVGVSLYIWVDGLISAYLGF